MVPRSHKYGIHTYILTWFLLAERCRAGADVRVRAEDCSRKAGQHATTATVAAANAAAATEPTSNTAAAGAVAAATVATAVAANPPPAAAAFAALNRAAGIESSRG